MMCRCTAMAGAQETHFHGWANPLRRLRASEDGEGSGRCRIFRWIHFTQRTFFTGFYPSALKKYALFFYLRVVYA